MRLLCPHLWLSASPIAGTHWVWKYPVTEVSLIPDLHFRIPEHGMLHLNFYRWTLAFTLVLCIPPGCSIANNHSWCLGGLTRVICNWSKFADSSAPCSVSAARGTQSFACQSEHPVTRETNRPLKVTSCSQKARTRDFWIGWSRLKSNWFKSWFESLVRKSRLNQYFPFKTAFIFYIILMHWLHNSDRDRCGFHF